MSKSTHLIVLAAGRSERMGERDKLRMRIGGLTVLEQTVSAAVNTKIVSVIVVTGPDDYRDMLDSWGVRSVTNQDFEEGMGASIRTGVGACPSAAMAYGILPADMPFVTSATIGTLAAQAASDRIVVPIHKGRQGHPVFFAAAYRDELLALEGDVGARSVIESHLPNVMRIDTEDEGVLRDIDSSADMDRSYGLAE